MVVRAYLRASTGDQDAERARGALAAFAAEHGLAIVSTYVENESGARLDRPELFRLLKDCRRPCDILLVEQVDRLSRLTTADWQKQAREGGGTLQGPPGEREAERRHRHHAREGCLVVGRAARHRLLARHDRQDRQAPGSILVASWSIQGRAARRTIPYAVLFNRTNPALAPKTLRHIKAELTAAGIPTLDTEITDREAFRAIFSFGGSVRGLAAHDVSGVEKAAANAHAFAAEMVRRLKALDAAPPMEAAH